VKAEDFSRFTYAKRSHFDDFGKLDRELYGEKRDSDNCDLKAYQDLLVLAFINANVPPASRLLEVGGGDSRIIDHLKTTYECWNLDKLEGHGFGPRTIREEGFRLVRDYIGSFNRLLPDGYFDLVFSISVLEHVASQAESLFAEILGDINRVLRPGGMSLHCFDVLIGQGSMFIHPLLRFFFDTQKTINAFVDPSVIMADSDLYVMSESAYRRYWQPATGKTYSQMGRPSSYNVLWYKRP
jgi:ubiquinone/menaquinone biosynthesis C-methylase UbiE